MKKHSKNSYSFGLSLILILGLCGCASYKARPLSQLTPASATSFVENDSINFSYRIFDQYDCKRYLDRDVISKGYQPIHITITNNSSDSVNFSLNNISLPIIDAYEVAQEVHTNTVGRAVGYGVTAVFIWPFAIPAIVDGIGSQKSNERLDYDFYHKVLRDQMIHPHTSMNGLLFVPTEVDFTDFQITLTGVQSSEPILLSTRQTQTSPFYACNTI